MPGLGETPLMTPQSYLRMQGDINMTFTIDNMELIIKDGSIFLIWYDSGTNIPLLDNFHDYYDTETVGRIYKWITNPAYLNLSHQEKHIMWWQYNMGHIGF